MNCTFTPSMRSLASCGVLLVMLAACARMEGVADGVRARFAGSGEEVRASMSVQEPDARPAVSGPVIWDGRPSLGGVWVAHPDVSDPRRVSIRRAAGGPGVEGWLFRREPPETGPPLQISSAAADELGIGAGVPTEVVVEPREDEAQE